MIRIDVLPDEVLLTIFDFYVVPDLRTKPEIEKWISLVHVCRRWRSLVFQSPCRLNLRLFCTPETPARDTLDVWPALPLVIDGNASEISSATADNILFALGHNNRIHDIGLWDISGFQLERVLAAMQVPFPKVIHLQLAASPFGETLRAIPDSFLGGSAPCLRRFVLDDIPFPGLSKFLLSTTHLVDLHLVIPLYGYITPEEMVTCLSVLTSLENFALIFQRFRYHPDRDRETHRSPLATCSVHPALEVLEFQGYSGYLEDLVARIEAPRLSDFFISFNYLPNFSIPQLFEFISRTPTLKAPVEAHAVFERYNARVKLIPQTSGRGGFQIRILSRNPVWQLSSLVQVLASSSCPLFTVENLYIEDQGSSLAITGRIETTQWWWEFLRPFVAVKNIYLFEPIAFHIAHSLQALGGGRGIEVLPALQEIFLRPPEVGLPYPSGLVHSQGPMEQFVAARQLLGQTITITDSQWQESRRRDDD